MTLKPTPLVAIALGATLLGVAAWLGACSDSGGPPDPFVVSQGSDSAIVSDPVPTPTPSGRRASFSVVGSASIDLAYVSLPPGTVPEGELVTIRSLRTTGTVTAAMTAGGFDPLPIAATAGDSVQVTVSAGGRDLVSFMRAVPTTRRPIVIRTDPPPGKRDQPLNARIVVVFSEPVAGASITTASVQLLRGTSPVAGMVSLLQGSATAAVFIPTAPLTANTAYRVVVTQGIKDLEGDALAAETGVPFSTGTAVEGPVASVRVFPDSVGIRVGSQVQLTAVPQDTQGRLLAGRPTTWRSGNDTVAAVSATGLVTGLVEGYTFIMADVEGQSDGTHLSVSASLAPIGSVTVTPESARVAVGDSLVVAVDMRDSAGNIVWIPRPITWSSTNPGVATVTPYYSRSALVRGVANGITRVVASVEGKADTSVVAVGPPGAIVALELSPNPVTTVLQGTVQLSAFVRDAQGFRSGIDSTQVLWVSSDPPIASTNAAGLVTGLRAGSATITGTWNGHQGTANTTVVSLAFTAISAGGGHTCGLTPSGAAYCWGYGWDGQLGTGTRGYAPLPTAVASGHLFSTLSVYSDTCSLDGGGAAYCWGLNRTGQDTCPNGACSATPVAVAGGLKFTAFSTGGWRTCGLTGGGAAYCWTGLDWSKTPDAVPVPGGLTFAAIRAGLSHTCALTAGGVAYCWGSNSSGQLGTGDTLSSETPRPVAGGLTFTALSAGETHTCGVTSSEDAYCWGSLNGGSLRPLRWTNGFTLVALASGPAPYGTCGLDASGTIHCLGLSPPDQHGLVFTQITVGIGYSCAVTNDRVGYCWGRNDMGQLGLGTLTPYEPNPVKVGGQP